MVDEDTEPQVRVDPTTGRPILMAPRRQARPILTSAAGSGDDAANACPFCGGEESRTPPEILAVRPDGGPADSGGWTVRVFPNLYPAAVHHEVIAEGATHEEQPARLGVGFWKQAIPVWNERILAVESGPDIACAFFFKNVCREAGASIAHNHSQIIGLRDLPPRLALEREQVERLGHCPFCRSIDTAAEEGRSIHEDEHHVVLCPDPPKLPFETWLLPRDCGDQFASTDTGSLARSLHSLFVAVDEALGGPAFNLWLHRIPGERFHWHFELQPRTGFLAGLELGGDMYINAVPAAQAAARLRGALAK